MSVDLDDVADLVAATGAALRLAEQIHDESRSENSKAAVKAAIILAGAAVKLAASERHRLALELGREKRKGNGSP
jgi:hypothetical protein